MKKIVSVICLLIFVLPLFGCGDYRTKFDEDAEVVINPDRGFYQPFGKRFLREGNEAISVATLEYYTRGHSILHFRFGLEDFSSAMGGESVELSEDMLDALRATLENLRLVDASCILRFSYDVDGDSYYTDIDPEPNLDLVLTHVDQLGKVIGEFTDVVSAIEGGMFGPWGEQHSTALSGLNDAYYYLVEAWHKNITNRTISLRRPRYVLHWSNRKNNTSYKISEIEKVVVPDNYMVGVYNDGYLGSVTDLGTYSDREKELEWLESITNRTLFGGEVVADSSDGGVMGDYNKPSNLYTEAYKTHTSYLNEFWNGKVVDEWKKSKYAGDNKAFKGKSDFDFIASHLGYRFVADTVGIKLLDNTMLNLELSLENKGFGNLVNKKSVYLIIKTDNGFEYFETTMDPRTWKGKMTIHADINFNGIGSGASEVYLKISDEKDKYNNLRSVRFANKDMWNENLGANYMGKL